MSIAATPATVSLSVQALASFHIDGLLRDMLLDALRMLDYGHRQAERCVFVPPACRWCT
jgi:hypothetical protein